MLSATRPAGQPDAEPTVRTQVWTGTAVAADDGWRVDQLTVGIDDCLPPELNEQLLAAYRDWHEAQARWSEPPDPEHPLLEQTMVDPGLSDARDLLLEDQQEGVAWRYPHDPANAVVTDLGIGQARVIDCHEAHPDYGAFDLETGERREDLSPAPEQGQMNRVVVDLERVAGGDWKVNGWRSERDSTCTPGETSYAVP